MGSLFSVNVCVIYYFGAFVLLSSKTKIQNSVDKVYGLNIKGLDSKSTRGDKGTDRRVDETRGGLCLSLVHVVHWAPPSRNTGGGW